MTLSSIVHVVLLELLGNQGEPSASVGPLAIGLAVDEVRNRLGPGIGTHDCSGVAAGTAPRDACDLVWRFTDGRSTAVVRFLAGRKVSSIELHLDDGGSHAARLARRAGTIASWSWAGQPAGRFPGPHVSGWLAAEYAAGRACHADFEIPDISASVRCAPDSGHVAVFSISEH